MATLPSRRRDEPDQPDGQDLLNYALLRGVAGFVLFGAVRRHRVLAASCLLVVLALSAVALVILPRRWEVRASLVAQANPLVSGTVREVDRLRAVREVVLRRDNVSAILAQTNFVDRHMAGRGWAARTRDALMTALRGHELTPEERLEGLIDAVESRLWVVAGQEGTITVGFEWSNPELAYDVVKEALQNFVEAREKIEVSSYSETLAILAGHLATAQKEIAAVAQRLADKEQKLRHSQKRAPPRVRVAPDTELAKIDALLETKRRSARAIEEYRARRIAELRSELAQQERVYAPAHPLVVATKRSLDEMSKYSPELETLRLESDKLEREIKSRGGEPGETTKLFRDDLAEARLRLEDEDPRLEQERHELRLAFRNYTNLLAEITTARIASDTARVGFKYRYVIVNPPKMPRGPMWPRPPRILAMALVGGLVLGLFAAAAADLRTGIVLEPWQLDGQLGVPILADLRPRAPGA